MPFDPIKAAQNAQFVQFVYNMFEAAPNSLKPPVDPGLAAKGYRLLHFLNAHDFQSKKFYGYLAGSIVSPGDLILAIRGTETFQEWLLNFNALPLPYLGKGFVPAGFRSIAESFQLNDATGTNVGNLTTVLNMLNAQTPIKTITVLGHSLGGALATLAAAQIAFAGVPNNAALSMWTYASPTIAFKDFADAFNQAVPNAFRVWNTLDVVPLLPPLYLHVGQSEPLKQTQAQIQQLLASPPCEHHLTTYEWLLDAPQFPLDNSCQLAAIQAVSMAVGAVQAQSVAAPSETAVGAAALALAVQQQ